MEKLACMLSLLFSFFSLFSSVFCRETLITDDHRTSILDVAVSIERTLQVLSFDPQTTTPLLNHDPNRTFPISSSSSSSSSSGVLSLELHPREAVLGPAHKDYRALLLSRLGRDAARVRSILSRLQEEESESSIRPEILQAPVVSGTSQGSGEYFVRVGFGTPPRPMYMVPDTGSDVNWIQCKPCTSCYRQSDPVFDPKESSSYARLGCGSRLCADREVSGCTNNLCTYKVAYGDGSYTIGDFATETLSFGSSKATIPRIALGCGHDNKGLFVGTAGLLGLGGGPLSLTSQVNAKALSYCFVNRDTSASSTLEFDSPGPADSVTAPLFRSQRVRTFFYVGLTGLSVGSQALPIDPSVFKMDPATGRGGVIVDSGTAVTRLPTKAYVSLRDAFRGLTGDLRSAGGVAIFDTCYDLSSLASVRVPTVEFRFDGGKSLLLPARNYLVPVDSFGTFCLAFAPTTSSLSIIGNIQQQGTRVTYDLTHELIGFSPNKC